MPSQLPLEFSGWNKSCVSSAVEKMMYPAKKATNLAATIASRAAKSCTCNAAGSTRIQIQDLAHISKSSHL